METEQFLALFSISVWLGLCIAVGAFNQHKGGSFIAGLIVGMVVTPILGFIIVAVSKDDSRKCPFCFGRINERATTCPHCTREVTVGQDP